MDKGRSNKRQMKMKTEGTKIYECTKRSTKFYTDKCFPGRLMSAASIQKLFCGIYSALKCSFDEFVRKVVSLSYSSAIFITASVIFIWPFWVLLTQAFSVVAFGT